MSARWQCFSSTTGWASITIITVQFTNGRWLITSAVVHVFTINVVGHFTSRFLQRASRLSQKWSNDCFYGLAIDACLWRMIACAAVYTTMRVKRLKLCCVRKCVWTAFLAQVQWGQKLAATDLVLFSGKFDDSSLDMCITICITMPHTNTLISAPDLQINEEMAPDFRRKFTGAKNAFRLASFLCQKLAILNEALGCGRNDRHGTETSKSRKDTSEGRNVLISISANWFVGDL